MYMTLSTTSGRTVQATPDHLVLVLATPSKKQTRLVAMSDVQVGDSLWVWNGRDKMVWNKVVKVSAERGIVECHYVSKTQPMVCKYVWS